MTENNNVLPMAATVAAILRRNGLEPMMAQLAQDQQVLDEIAADWAGQSEQAQQVLLQKAIEDIRVYPELDSICDKLARQRSGFGSAVIGMLELLPLFVFLAGVKMKLNLKLGKAGSFVFEYKGDTKPLLDLVHLMLTKKGNQHDVDEDSGEKQVDD